MLLTSNNLLMLERSMDFLWAKQAAHLDNISNVETPGYKAKTVTFESELAERLEQAQRGARPKARVREVLNKATYTVHKSGDSARMDGNGVNITEQSLEAVRTAYQLQYVMRAISSDLTALRRAISG